MRKKVQRIHQQRYDLRSCRGVKALRQVTPTTNTGHHVAPPMASLSLKARGSKGANQRDIFFYSLSVLTSCVRSIRNFLACASSPSSPSTSPQSTLPAAELDAAAAARAHAVLREEDATRSERPVLRQTRSGRGGAEVAEPPCFVSDKRAFAVGARRCSAGVAEKDPSAAVCLGPDIHKAASPAARWTHASPQPPTLLLPLLRPRLFSPPHTTLTPAPSLQKKSALAERKPQLNFMAPLLFAKLILQFKGTECMAMLFSEGCRRHALLRMRVCIGRCVSPR